MRCDAMRCDGGDCRRDLVEAVGSAVQCGAGASEVEREEGVTSRASLLVCIAY